jgi:periplasmic protein CpxP/Spy
MKRFMLTALLTSLLAVPVVQAADEEDHSAHHPPAEQGQANAAPDDMAGGMKMEEQMKKMRQQMEKIQATTDPRERQKLMEEHMQSMREGMKTMRGMGGNKMGMMDKDKPMMEDGGKEKDGKPMGMMMMKRHKMMEDRLDMMQMMMEQMMEHENVERMMERGR